MTLFRNKYRTESIRLKHWDYSRIGSYFITMCTQNRICWFGQIENAVIKYNTLGERAEQEVKNTEAIREYIRLDSFVIMPNHVHILLAITEEHIERQQNPETRNFASLREREEYINRFGPQQHNISSVVRGYKSAVTSWARRNGYPSFAWQPSFHEHIVRNEKSLEKLREYIHNNPRQWHIDSLNPFSSQ